LTAYPLDSSSGAIGSALWSASTLIPDATERTIYTRTTSPVKTVEFLWSKLDNAQQQALNLDTNGNQDGNGALRVDWLRGDQSREVGQSNGLFRREALCSAITSTPADPGQQPKLWYGDTILPPQGGPAPMHYVGANEACCMRSMNHRVEKFAYIPSSNRPTPPLTAIDYPTISYFGDEVRKHDARSITTAHPPDRERGLW
jgi:Tfp pilus tip-associated adhesin PilY1